MPRLVVFDFDGTITRSDSMLALARYRYGLAGYLIRMTLLVPWFFFYTLGFYPNQRFKERFLRLFFGGMKAEAFNKLCEKFLHDRLKYLLRLSAVCCMEKHQQAGDRVLVITASAENWVQPWCEESGVECLASRLEVTDGVITGKLIGKNCYGKEKVRRLLEVACPEEYDALVVYGDSQGDHALGEMATQYFYNYFK